MANINKQAHHRVAVQKLSLVAGVNGKTSRQQNDLWRKAPISKTILKVQDMKKLAKAILRQQCYQDNIKSSFELSILLTNDNGIAYINGMYRDKYTPTDVLSFPLLDFHRDSITWQVTANPFARPFLQSETCLLGDVIISYTACIRQAQQKNKELNNRQILQVKEGIRSKQTSLTERKSASEQATIKQEFLFLLIHGILHLFGYDHERSQNERIQMEKREKELLEFVMVQRDQI